MLPRASPYRSTGASGRLPGIGHKASLWNDVLGRTAGVSAAGAVRRALRSMPRSLPPRRGDGALHVQKADPVGKNRLLQRTNAADLARLQPHLKNFPMELGAVLHAPGASIKHVYFPLSGMVSLLAVSLTRGPRQTALVIRGGGPRAALASRG